MGTEDDAAAKQLGQRSIAVAEVVDPNRGVDEDHWLAARRRGIGVSAGSVPPRRARRRALSRSIRALRPSRTSNVFSFTPVGQDRCRARRLDGALDRRAL
jgi:hypothetical protein